MKMKRTTSKEIALCGVLAALALTVMILGGMFPAASYCCPVLACILLVPVVETCGQADCLGLVWGRGSSQLPAVPGPGGGGPVPVFGLLPHHKGPPGPNFPGSPPGPCQAGPVPCGLRPHVHGAPVCPVPGAGSRNLPPGGPWMLAVGLALGILTFFLTDFLLTRLERLYRQRVGKKLS